MIEKHVGTAPRPGPMTRRRNLALASMPEVYRATGNLHDGNPVM